MQPTATYQPYRGYGTAHPWYWYACYPNPLRRVRTRSDWRLDIPPVDDDGDENAVWQRPFSNRRESAYQKRLAHRRFRRRVRLALRDELTLRASGDDYPAISHRFRYYGDWLD